MHEEVYEGPCSEDGFKVKERLHRMKGKESQAERGS